MDALGRDRTALAAKASPVAQLSVAAERLRVSLERGGPLLTSSELRDVANTFSELKLTAEIAAGGNSVKELYVALVTWALWAARWPTSTSDQTEAATVSEACGILCTALSLFEQLLPSPSLPPAYSRTTVWASALLCGDLLPCVSRRLQSRTEAVLWSLDHPCSGSTGRKVPCAGGSSASNNSLSASTATDPHELSSALTQSMQTLALLSLAVEADRSSRSGALRRQLVEAVRNSHVLEHVARGMAVLAMHRGAAVARADAGEGQSRVALQRHATAYEGINQGVFDNLASLQSTGTTPSLPDKGCHQQQQQQQQPQAWPPSMTEVDPLLCGPWSRHLLLAWGLHHLHALDGGGHCGLHPDMVRGLPPVWEPPPAPQAAGPSTSAGTGEVAGAGAGARGGASARAGAGAGAGAAGGAGSSAPRVLQASALLRLVHLLRSHNKGRAVAMSEFKELSMGLKDMCAWRAAMARTWERLDLDRRAASGDVPAETMAAVRKAEVDFQHAAETVWAESLGGGGGGKAPGGTQARGEGGAEEGQSEASDSAMLVGSTGTALPQVLVPQAVVRHVAARLMRAAAASAWVWQREEGRGGGAREEREGQGRAGGAAAGAAGQEEGAGAAVGAAAAGQPLVLGREDAVLFAGVGIMMYHESVLAVEERMRGRQQAAEEAAAAGAAAATGEGAGEAGRRGRPVSVRLRTEMYRLSFEAVLAVVPLGDEAGAQRLSSGVRLCFEELPPAGEDCGWRRPVAPSVARLLARCLCFQLVALAARPFLPGTYASCEQRFSACAGAALTDIPSHSHTPQTTEPTPLRDHPTPRRLAAPAPSSPPVRRPTRRLPALPGAPGAALRAGGRAAGPAGAAGGAGGGGGGGVRGGVQVWAARPAVASGLRGSGPGGGAGEQPGQGACGRE